jgi:hypothetical protein
MCSISHPTPAVTRPANGSTTNAAVSSRVPVVLIATSRTCSPSDRESSVIDWTISEYVSKMPAPSNAPTTPPSSSTL